MEPLAGRTIAIAETRELDVFAAIAGTARCARAALSAGADRRCARSAAGARSGCAHSRDGGCDDLILLTGEGLRRLLRCIDSHEPALRRACSGSAGASAQDHARAEAGARAARARAGAAISPPRRRPPPGSSSRCGHSRSRGRRVGVQLYGEDPNQALIDFLQRSRRHASPRWRPTVMPMARPRRDRRTAGELQAGRVDAIAFTSKAQVERLFAAADPERVRAALAATNVAAVGPGGREHARTPWRGHRRDAGECLVHEAADHCVERTAGAAG